MWIFVIIAILFIVISVCAAVFINVKGNVKKAFAGVTINNIDAINGAEFEEVVCAMLKYYFWNAKTTPKSHDYGADIIAKRGFKTVIIQTKLYYNHAVGNSAVQEIVAAKKYYKCNRAVVVTNWHFSKSAIKLANKNKVILVGREQIVKFLKKMNK